MLLPSCNSSYGFTTKKVTVYKFSVGKNKNEAFIKVIPPQNLMVTNYTVVYKKNKGLLQQNCHLFMENINLPSRRRFFKLKHT